MLAMAMLQEQITVEVTPQVTGQVEAQEAQVEGRT